MEPRPYDNQYKLLLIGDSSVGKTSILLRFVDQSFFNNYVATIGIDYKIKNIVLADKTIRLQIWDTAGQERFRTITAAYFRKAMGILLTYDITNQKSFESVSIWLQNIQKNAPEDIQLILLANKCDLDAERVVSYEKGEELAKTHNIKFFEVSAKEDINVNEAFLSLSKSIKDKQEGIVEGEEEGEIKEEKESVIVQQQSKSEELKTKSQFHTDSNVVKLKKDENNINKKERSCC